MSKRFPRLSPPVPRCKQCGDPLRGVDLYLKRNAPGVPINAKRCSSCNDGRKETKDAN
jgi:ribosomal protein L34E